MRRLAPSPAEGRSLVPPHAPTAQQQIIASQATRAQATAHPATSTDAHSASHLLSLSLSPQGTRWRARVPPTPRVFHRVALVRHDERHRARDEGPAGGPHKVTESGEGKRVSARPAGDLRARRMSQSQHVPRTRSPWGTGHGASTAALSVVSRMGSRVQIPANAFQSSAGLQELHFSSASSELWRCARVGRQGGELKCRVWRVGGRVGALQEPTGGRRANSRVWLPSARTQFFCARSTFCRGAHAPQQAVGRAEEGVSSRGCHGGRAERRRTCVGTLGAFFSICSTVPLFGRSALRDSGAMVVQREHELERACFSRA